MIQEGSAIMTLAQLRNAAGLGHEVDCVLLVESREKALHAPRKYRPGLVPRNLRTQIACPVAKRVRITEKLNSGKNRATIGGTTSRLQPTSTPQRLRNGQILLVSNTLRRACGLQSRSSSRHSSLGFFPLISFSVIRTPLCNRTCNLRP